VGQHARTAAGVATTTPFGVAVIIAAEGRKYGLLLILGSQRPDKLDHLILSECANKAIMRLDSRTIVQLVREKNNRIIGENVNYQNVILSYLLTINLIK
jgi:hypothetical protein